MNIDREKLLAMLGPAAKKAVMAQINDKAPPPAVSPRGKKRIRSKPIYVDDIRFDSTGEGNYYCQLKLRVKAGELKRFHRQVIFDLGGGRQLRLDFMLIYPDGRIEYVDYKGYAMEDYLVKRDICEAMYGIKVTEIHPHGK